MDNTIIVALLSCAGTLIGSVMGIMTTAKMTAYRLEQLEKKGEKHNNLVERMAAVEQSTKSAHHRIDALHEE